ncbi:Cof-type HAD-IIB family hydrolase [Paenibacillus sediminis]|uniref:Cof subfamily protein (Haloacid dehalogenase superfamily) n=1 Tax=Paenibacillus sediminis TaxID=664909 RepID=A0ABS4H5B2_9BACL|nr:Cof-type HAD-IIB family hydrolase [Paenibacillus sediminis]MBP1937723.1 Cof subfamily protein (haloacid dehalogenase superfamily) [Paenibacillus sediminis]
MKYKLVALDIDGTLLNDNYELTDRTAETIKKVAAQGTEIVLCTGRGPANSIPYMKQLGLKGYVLSHNGAATVDVETREIVHQFPLNPQGLDPYIHYCRDHGIHFDVNTAFGLYVDSVKGLALETAAMYEKYLMEPLDLPAWADFSEPIVKFTAFGEAKVLDKVYSEWSTWTPEFNMFRSGEYFIDLMHPEASKGAALRYLAEQKGIKPSEVLAIGNYFNDISMITYAGTGIAMGNSPDGVIAAADDVTATNNEDGVHQALVKYCLS